VEQYRADGQERKGRDIEGEVELLMKRYQVVPSIEAGKGQDIKNRK